MELYLKSSSCISAQNTFDGTIPNEIIGRDESFYSCIAPDYKKIISPKLLRRMSPIIRNGVAAGITALQNGNVELPDAVIVGTALGCLKDTSAFLSQLILEDEELPNPTYFIQSTHNTIAGQIALLLNCKNYNFTFSQGHNSFECALLDAQMFLLDKQGTNVLVGGVDEMSESLEELVKDLKCYNGVKLGEGAGFFTLSSQSGPVVFNGVQIFNEPISDFDGPLGELGLSINDVDLVIGGDNAIDDDNYFSFKKAMEGKPYLWYKPFMGEFGTASALALWLACKIIEEQCVPDCWRMNSIPVKACNTILISNYVGGAQSIMLISKNKAQ